MSWMLPWLVETDILCVQLVVLLLGCRLTIAAFVGVGGFCFGLRIGFCLVGCRRSFVVWHRRSTQNVFRLGVECALGTQREDTVFFLFSSTHPFFS